ncbi:MAG TPA: hypothetical protein VEJ84_18255, partial [Acidimicrobiales bacterium]|nr:hypothetical protein [Acidimicrobiales bacterium]
SDDVVEAVSEGCDGNPLFLEERLATFVETGGLTQDDAGWHLDEDISPEVPEAIERIVRSRVDRLAPGPREAIVSGSVLGPEFGESALAVVTDLDGGLAGALSELCSAGLLSLQQTGPEPVYRFRHSLIQEITYGGLVRDERHRLHARAAWGLEAASAGRLEEVAHLLGHHFAMAGEAERAAHYWEVAGDRAASNFANDEAVEAYRAALGLTSTATAAGRAAAAGLRLQLGQVLDLAGRRGEARQVLEEALAPGHELDDVTAALLQALLGKVEVGAHRYDAALAAFDAADELIGEHPEDADQATADLWLEVQLGGRVTVHYFRNEMGEVAAVMEKARPVLEARGTPARRRAFHHGVALQRARERRYQIDDETLAAQRVAAAITGEGVGEPEIVSGEFGLGLFLLFHGDLDEAEERLSAALAMAERVGDAGAAVRCRCYYSVTALRRHDVEGVRARAPVALEAAEAASYPEYAASAKAMLAWLAWRDGRPDDVLGLGREALRLWAGGAVAYPFYWLCLWPLIAVHLGRGEVADAVAAARQLLLPPQQKLPDELEAQVEAAIACWEGGSLETGASERAASDLRKALELGEALRYA